MSTHDKNFASTPDKKGRWSRLFGRSEAAPGAAVGSGAHAPAEGRATRSCANISACAENSRAQERAERASSAQAVSKAKVSSAASKHVVGVSSTAAVAGKPVSKRSVLAAIFAAMMAVMLAFTMSPMQGLADSLRPVDSEGFNGTVPADEGYTSTITSYYDGTPSIDDDTVVNSNTPPTNVIQSTNPNSARTFASGLPLSTIYIDQSKIFFDTDKNEDPTVVVPDMSFHHAPGSPYASLIDFNPNTGYATYNAAAATNKLTPGSIHKLEGDLFYYIFPDAAILPNGDRADLKITYSNARIVVDQRLSEVPTDKFYNGSINLAAGGTFVYGGSDTRIISSYGVNLVKEEEKKW